MHDQWAYWNEVQLDFFRPGKPTDNAFWARHYQLAASEMEEDVFRDEEGERDIQTFRIRFASGHEIVALSSAPRGFRSKQGRAVIDEAAFHDNLPALLKSGLAFLMWGDSVRIISTHNGDDSALNEMIQDVCAGKKPYSLRRTTFEEALTEGLYKRICLRLGREWTPAGETEWRQAILEQYGDDADEELHCVPKAGGGAYLSRQLIEARMRADYPVLRLVFDDAFTRWEQHLREAEVRDWCERELAPLLARLDPRRNHYLGEDFGRSVDLTGIAPIEEAPDLSRQVPFLLELRNVPFEQQCRCCSTCATACRASCTERWTRAATASTWPRWLSSATARTSSWSCSHRMVPRADARLPRGLPGRHHRPAQGCRGVGRPARVPPTTSH